MGISGVGMWPSPTSGGTKPTSDTSVAIQKLEQQKKGIEQQLKQLEQGKQSADAINSAKGKLQKQLKEIDKQIGELQQQRTSKVPSTEDDTNLRPPRYDKYVDSADQPAERSAGIYELSMDDDGNPIITFESPNNDRPFVDGGKPEIMKATVDKDKVAVEIKNPKEKQQLNQ